jgi:hypothetical protein
MARDLAASLGEKIVVVHSTTIPALVVPGTED